MSLSTFRENKNMNLGEKNSTGEIIHIQYKKKHLWKPSTGKIRSQAAKQDGGHNIVYTKKQCFMMCTALLQNHHMMVASVVWTWISYIILCPITLS